MAVIKEWKCATHGSFVGSHPICPAYGCTSQDVQREFLTPVGISKGKYAAFDKGIRQTAESYKIRDFRTVRGGEVSFAGRVAEESGPLGTRVLWGDEVAKEMGRDLATQIAAAAAPLTVKNPKHPNDPHLTHNSAMRNLANDPGAPPVLRAPSVLPPATIQVPKADYSRPT